MDEQIKEETVRNMFLLGTVREMLKFGILAADESQGTAGNPKTIEERLIKDGIEGSSKNVNAWRELVRGTPNLGDYLSAVILEKSRVLPDAKIYAEMGIVPGVKVDGGTGGHVDKTNERLTVGLEFLPEMLPLYYQMGARFAKWRTVTPIGTTTKGIEANIATQIKYAKECQNARIVPICEPEVLIDGNHSIDDSYRVTKQVLTELFRQAENEVYLRGMILRTSMVIHGKGYEGDKSIAEVAEKTLELLREVVPKELGGVVFLSGGQSDEQAVQHLNLMKKRVYDGKFDIAWPLTFSYSRAIQHDPMQVWQGNPKYVALAQELLLERARACALASRGALPQDFKYTTRAPRAL